MQMSKLPEEGTEGKVLLGEESKQSRLWGFRVRNFLQKEGWFLLHTNILSVLLRLKT